jgi:long-chain acyl-CoA synthetase
MGGGAAVHKTVAQRWKAVTGVPVLECYGLSEASPIVCINPVDLETDSGRAGLPVPSTDISVRDEAGAETGIGAAGELWVRGPQVMRGYLNRPAETAKVLTDDGWLKTGDIAAVDAAGFVRIVERKKDMIQVSGFDVYPSEIEDVVATCDGVREVACVGVPDERSGEAVKLLVVPHAGRPLSEEAVRRHCHGRLTGYKTPKYVELREALPRSVVGRILRRQLR